MAKKTEAHIDELLDRVRADYQDEERLTADEEQRENLTSNVFSLRLFADLHTKVRRIATERHTTPSALLRQWVAERVEQEQEAQSSDLAAAVTALTRDVERIRALTRAA